MSKDYVININAPQAQCIYNWQQFNKEWLIFNEYCSNCGCDLKSVLPLTKFCPNCGFRIINIQNPNPPEKES